MGRTGLDPFFKTLQRALSALGRASRPSAARTASPPPYYVCPFCGRKNNVRESSIGTIRKCAECGAKIEVNAPEAGGSGCGIAVLVVAGMIGFGAALLVCCGGIAFLGGSKHSAPEETGVASAPTATHPQPRVSEAPEGKETNATQPATPPTTNGPKPSTPTPSATTPVTGKQVATGKSTVPNRPPQATADQQAVRRLAVRQFTRDEFIKKLETSTDPPGLWTGKKWATLDALTREEVLETSYLYAFTLGRKEDALAGMVLKIRDGVTGGALGTYHPVTGLKLD